MVAFPLVACLACQLIQVVAFVVVVVVILYSYFVPYQVDLLVFVNLLFYLVLVVIRLLLLRSSMNILK